MSKEMKIFVGGLPNCSPPFTCWCILITPEERKELEKSENRREFTEGYLASLIAKKVECDKISCARIYGKAPKGMDLGEVSEEVVAARSKDKQKQKKEKPVPRGFCDIANYLGNQNASA